MIKERREIAREFVRTKGASLASVGRKHGIKPEVVKGIVLSFYREPIYRRILRERGLDRFNNVVKVTVACEQCGAEKQVTENKARGKNFCNALCRDAWNALHHDRWSRKGMR